MHFAPCIIISGPSGVGKTTMAQALLAQFPQLTRVVTTTTRTARPEERHGIDYFFVSPEAFIQLHKAQCFLEINNFGLASYGTPRSLIHSLLNQKPRLALPDVHGAIQLKKQISTAICIWLEAPISVLTQRLAKRGTETEAQQQQRLSVAHSEIAQAHESGIYEYVIDMTEFGPAEAAIKRIIEAAL